MKNKIEIGDEVMAYNEKGEPMLGTRFIVTDMGDRLLCGIDFGGEIYEFESSIESFRKTGRHYDILGALRKLRDGEVIK